MRTPILFALIFTSTLALAQAEPTPAPLPAPVAAAPVAAAQVAVRAERTLPDIWSNRASFYVGVRGGVAVPPDATALAPNVSLELGVAVPKGFGIGLRAMWMNNPPGVPVFGLRPAAYGFGALADFRYYFATINPMTIYPTLSVGFLAGPDAASNRNLVMPLFNLGLGVKVKLGNVYGAFEFGVSGFTIPYVAFCVGFDGDSKLTRQRERLNLPDEDEVAVVEPAPAPAPQQPEPAHRVQRPRGQQEIDQVAGL